MLHKIKFTPVWIIIDNDISYNFLNIILVNLLDSDWLKTMPIKH
jgi:hypothetical protein